jgi:hypothetical protein
MLFFLETGWAETFVPQTEKGYARQSIKYVQSNLENAREKEAIFSFSRGSADWSYYSKLPQRGFVQRGFD